MNRRSVWAAFSAVLVHAVLLTSIMAVPLLSARAGKVAGIGQSTQVSLVSASALVAVVNPSVQHVEEATPDVGNFVDDSSVIYGAASAEISLAGLTDYLPASLLSERPAILNDIDPQLSDRFSGISAQSMTMLLLINEYGDVDKVLFDDLIAAESLPFVLRAELIQRFLEARFLPGFLHGRPVRSQLRIAVSLHP